MKRPWIVNIKKTEITGRTIFNITYIRCDPEEKQYFDVVVHNNNFNSVSAFEVIDDKQHSLSIEETEALIEKFKLKNIRETFTTRWWNCSKSKSPKKGWTRPGWQLLPRK